MKNQIKLSVTLKYGKDPEQEYRSGAVLSADHFPSDVFGGDPERTMANLVAGGSATWIAGGPDDSPAPVVVKSKDTSGDKTVKK